MSGHVPPHRWGDAFAGRLDDAERATIEAHAKECAKCARVRERIAKASDSFASIRTQPAPELPWDGVRARVHWSVSSERRRQRESPPAWQAWLRRGGLVAGLAGAAALAYVLVPTGDDGAPRAAAPVMPAPVAITPPVTPAPAPEPLAALVIRTTGNMPGTTPGTTSGATTRAPDPDILVDGARLDDPFAARLVAGNVIATGDARVDLQFADASGFALGPRSTLELRRFDAHAIELVLEGTIDIAVAPRPANQRFTVIAGDRTIEVRGTQFRVEHGAERTSVACRHGLVAVRDPRGQVEVASARRIEVAAGREVVAERVVALSVDEVEALAQATPMTMPLVGDLDALAKASAPLEIATEAAREVRVDGVELGLAPMRVRVLPGRHTVEVADAAGRFRRAGWIDVAAPAAGTAPRARLVVPPEPSKSATTSRRRRELQAGIDKPRLAQCTRTIAKQGLTDTYVVIEIAVDEQGAIGFLNVIDTDLPSSTARCVREVLADVAFRRGSAATWRERIDL